MKDPNPNHTPVSWTTFTLFGLVALGVLACRPGGGKASANPETTPNAVAADLLKGAALSLALGTPLLLAVFWLVEAAGSLWWLYAWVAWIAFTLAMTVGMIGPVIS